MKKMLVLLIALFVSASAFVPAYAEDAPAATATQESSTQAIPAKPTCGSTANAKLNALKALAGAVTKDAAASSQTCYLQICGGVSGCYQARCGAACQSC